MGNICEAKMLYGGEGYDKIRFFLHLVGFGFSYRLVGGGKIAEDFFILFSFVWEGNSKYQRNT